MTRPAEGGTEGTSRLRGLRARMAVSYVLVTAAAVLVVEAALLGTLLPRLLSGPDGTQVVRERADRDAKVLTKVASGIDTAATPQAQTDLLGATATAGADYTGLSGRPRKEDPVKTPISLDAGAVAVEALLAPDGSVVRSTAKLAYPVGSRLGVQIPQSYSGTGGTMAGGRKVAWAISAVLAVDSPGGLPEPNANAPASKLETAERGKQNVKLLGAVYVQVPADDVTGGSARSPRPVLLTGSVVLLLVVPVGLVFGLLSTGRLIRRVHRLADMTAVVADGDFRARVEVSGEDELGRLEHSVNRMAEQLDTALDRERRLAGAGARRSERARIARELHDSISQDLFSLSLLAGGMRRALPDDSALRSQAKAMERTAGRTMREMQALLLELRPVALEDTGLLPALEELCRAYETRLGIRVEALLTEVPLEPAVEHAVLRVVQESLGNAVKHADPQQIRLRLARDDGEGRGDGHGGGLCVEVTDDGRGFDVARVKERHGMGLELMRERVTELGGELGVTSRPGAGTVVRARFPGRAS